MTLPKKFYVSYKKNTSKETFFCSVNDSRESFFWNTEGFLRRILIQYKKIKMDDYSNMRSI